MKSMTAYARSERSTALGALVWELRSVNHRYLEFSIRLPEELRMLEQNIREIMSERLGRGKIDGVLRFKAGAGAAQALILDTAVAQQVLDACRQLQNLASDVMSLNPLELLRWQGVLQETQLDPAPLQKEALDLLNEAIHALIATREREGDRLQKIFQQRCQEMSVLVVQVSKRRPHVMQAMRDKIHTRLAELNCEPDNNRLEQEWVFLAQKLDVDEELQRLQTHLDEVQSVLLRDEPIGRRLDFLMQELNREANTLSAKSADIETTQTAVDMKVLIEQMREQVQNIE